MKLAGIPALAVFALLLSAACDDVTTNSAGVEPAAAARAPGQKLLGTITCHVDVASQSSRCGDLVPQGGANQSRVTLTSSHYALVTTSQFNSGGLAYFFNKIRNDIGQDIGTDSIFAYITSITTTGGSGTVTPSNHDGTRTFSAANQAYWAWDETVAPTQSTTTKIWQFNLPGTVTSWTYTIGVLAGIAHPDGWIDVSGDTQIPRGNTRQHTATAYEWTGAVDTTGVVSWSTTDYSGSAYASPWDDRQGTVLGVRVGYATVTASKGIKTPRTRTVEVY